jgi:hypothetical protein
LGIGEDRKRQRGLNVGDVILVTTCTTAGCLLLMSLVFFCEQQTTQRSLREGPKVALVRTKIWPTPGPVTFYKIEIF